MQNTPETHPNPGMPIFARLAVLPGLDLASESGLPTSIQWMPPGEREVDAYLGTKTWKGKVKPDPQTAERLNLWLSTARATAAKGLGDLPYFDFNHDDAAASGHPTRFYWDGDGPKGGIRVELDWTVPGKEAVIGKSYRRFSPAFHVNADGQVIGVPLNMGGLVNRAAFKTIEPIWSRGSAGQDANQTMNEQTELADLKAAITAKDSEIAQLKQAIAGEDHKAEIQAKDTEIQGLKTQITDMEAKLAVQAKASAQALVDAAVADGRIAPQADGIKTKWVEILAKNPEMADLLTALPKQVVGKQVVPPVNAKSAQTDAPKDPPPAREVWAEKKETA